MPAQGTIFRSSLAKQLEESLDTILTDDSDEFGKVFRAERWMKVGTMDKAFMDQMDQAGPAYVSVKTEGSEVQFGTMKEGRIKRYIPVTYALRLGITEEAIQDRQLPQALRLARKLKLAMIRTQEVVSTNVLARGWDTNYVGRDSQPLFSASHLTASDQTYSNTLSTPLAPSVEALETVINNLLDLPGNDGVVDGEIMPKAVVFPNPQWGDWSRIRNSKYTPELNNFSEINVISNDFPNLDFVRLPFWQNTNTNWAVVTDVDDGVQFLWRQRPRDRRWNDNAHTQMNYSISARFTTGWTDPRGMFGSQA